VQLSPGAAGQKTRALAKVKVVLPTFSLVSVHTRNIKYLNGGQFYFQDLFHSQHIWLLLTGWIKCTENDDKHYTYLLKRKYPFTAYICFMLNKRKNSWK